MYVIGRPMFDAPKRFRKLCETLHVLFENGEFKLIILSNREKKRDKLACKCNYINARRFYEYNTRIPTYVSSNDCNEKTRGGVRGIA